MTTIGESKDVRHRRLLTVWHVRTRKLMEHTPGVTPLTELLAKANLNQVIGTWLRMTKGGAVTLLGLAISATPENTEYKLYLRYKNNTGKRYTHKDAFFTATVESVDTPLPAGENHATDQAAMDTLLKGLFLEGTYRQSLIKRLNLLAAVAVKDLLLYPDIWLYETHVGPDGWVYRFRLYDEEAKNIKRITLVFDRQQLQTYDNEIYQDMKALVARKNVVTGPWGKE